MLFSEDTLADFFEKQVERLPDHEFLIYPDRNLRFTYSEADRQRCSPLLPHKKVFCNRSPNKERH